MEKSKEKMESFFKSLPDGEIGTFDGDTLFKYVADEYIFDNCRFGEKFEPGDIYFTSNSVDRKMDIETMFNNFYKITILLEYI